MNPDAALQELRELYNEEEWTPDIVERFITLFDDLDNWIISGGFLPKEWQR